MQDSNDDVICIIFNFIHGVLIGITCPMALKQFFYTDTASMWKKNSGKVLTFAPTSLTVSC